MTQPKFCSQLRPSVARSSRLSGVQPGRQPTLRSFKPQLETLEDRVVPSGDVTLPLQNYTGLDPTQYSVYLVGFSTAPGQILDASGQFVTPGTNGTSTSYIQGYNISTMPSITMDPSQALSGRIYFFVEPNDQPAPRLPFTGTGGTNPIAVSQPQNPPSATFSGLPAIPSYTYPSGFVPYDIIEFTDDGNSAAGASAIHIDTQTVDGFFFPLTLTEELNPSGQATQILGQVGQTLNLAVYRADIIAAYTAFMNSQLSNGVSSQVVQAYLDLVDTADTFAGQDGGDLNPGMYLGAGANSGSVLNTLWDPVLSTLFTTSSRTISMTGDDGDYYQGTPMQVGSDWVLHFVGYTAQSGGTVPNGNVFNIYDPDTKDPLGSYQSNESAGEMVFANDGVFADSSSNVLQPLTYSPASPPSGTMPPSISQQPNSQWIQYTPPSTSATFMANASSYTTVQWQVSTDGGSGWTNLSDGTQGDGSTVSGSASTTLQLSNIPTTQDGYEYRAVFTSGSGTAYTNGAILGISADSGSTVVLGLERDIVSALNRGVATLAPSGVNAGTSGGASLYWGTQTNWYPATQTQNLFSLFMHTGTANGDPIFTQPANPGPANDAQGTPMSSAYGFGYDENPGHGPAGQPNVPSKWDPASSQANTIVITLGPWFKVEPASPTPSPGPSPSPAPTPTPGPPPTGAMAVLFMAEDQFAYTLDSLFEQWSNNPLLTQLGDWVVSVFNDLLHQDNPALFTGLNGLQMGMSTNPYQGSAWGLLGQAIGAELALNFLSHTTQS